MKPLIKCAVCSKPVDGWDIVEDRIQGGWSVTVACHGNRETKFIDYETVYQLQKQYGIDATIHGVAFEQKGIANV